MSRFFENTAMKLIGAATFNWRPHSRLILYGEDANWSLNWDIRELARISRRIGVRLANPVWKHAATPQCVFFSSQFFLSDGTWQRFVRHRIAFSYFHGIPNEGFGELDAVFEGLRKLHEMVTRVQVTHHQMREVVLQTGIDPSKVFLIPIGVNLDFFPFRTAEQKWAARSELGIPQSAFVIGSFQKDGVGWGDGLQPKLVKGPDIFLSTLRKVKDEISEMFVLLTGPSRGYMMRGLDEFGIPYRHAFLKSYPDVAKMYRASDMYLVASRQEGGPKAVLESMASGVPLVTTRVGQAMELVKHGENAWMADVEDAEGLAEGVRRVYNMGQNEMQTQLAKGRATAEANSYESQDPLWADFMKGFVETY